MYDESRVHRSWSWLFSPDILRTLDAIEERVGPSYAPDPGSVLRFASTDLGAVRVVVLGQDPYAQAGLSTGRAFESAGVSSWAGRNLNSSLRNIVRNVYRTTTGHSQKFDSVRRQIESGKFPILPPNELFDAWERQGVLLLNAYQTCAVGSPGSHIDIWRPFAASLVRFITAKRPDVLWFLWGKEPRALWNRAIVRFAVKRDSYRTYAYPHPSYAGRGGDDSFIDCDCFEVGARECGIDWTGTGETG